MCGIFGIWRRDGRPVDLEALRRATGSMRHRGPDDEGYLLVNTHSGRAVLCGGPNTAPELALPNLEQFFGEQFDFAFGFRRLSILDLSAAGHQPMPSPGGRYWLLFNGEIYNYLELRTELSGYGYTFKSGSDSEVILAAYDRWGSSCLHGFNGMWGMAIWDNSRRELFVARDRFGVKPFYVVDQPGGTFAFASEIKALLAAGTVPFSPYAPAIARFVAQSGFLSHEEGKTFFEGVWELPAAHYAVVSRDSYSPIRFWGLPSRDEITETYAREAVAQYGDLFTDSVRLRLRADVAVGTCLSGGVDSSSIVAVAGQLMRQEHAISLERLGEHQQTFSAVYDEQGPWNERRYVDMVLGRTHAAGNYVFPTGERLWQDLPRLVWHQDEPFQSTSIFAQWCVMDLARQRGVTVLLDGQGADEVLAGYRPFDVLVGELLGSGRLGSAVRVARDVRAITGVSLLPLLRRALVWHLPDPLLTRARLVRLRQSLGASGLVPELSGRLFSDASSQAEPFVAHRNLHEHLVRQVVEDSLPNLLRYEDRNSMAFSIEARVPFLDYRLVEYVFAKAGRWRIHRGWTKWIQRMAVRDLLPREVVWRRDKVGFETPEQKWLREGKEHLVEIVSQDSTGSEYLDLGYVRDRLPELVEQGNTGLAWRWVNLVMWLREFKQQATSEA